MKVFIGIMALAALLAALAVTGGFLYFGSGELQFAAKSKHAEEMKAKLIEGRTDHRVPSIPVAEPYIEEEETAPAQ